MGVVAVALIAGAAPARADVFVGLSGPDQSAAVVTCTSVIAPMHPRLVTVLHNAGTDTNLIGCVLALPSSADDQPYVLKRTSGAGNLDALFYETAGGNQIGPVCSNVDGTDDDPLNFTKETGTICPGAQVGRWAVITLKWGLNEGFTFTY
jgi:hypothetical protein